MKAGLKPAFFVFNTASFFVTWVITHSIV